MTWSKWGGNIGGPETFSQGLFTGISWEYSPNIKDLKKELAFYMYKYVFTPAFLLERGCKLAKQILQWLLELSFDDFFVLWNITEVCPNGYNLKISNGMMGQV